MMHGVAYLVGGRKEGRRVDGQVFSLKVMYDDAGRHWEMHDHLDLGPGFPFVLQADSDNRSADEIRELVRSWGLGPAESASQK